MIKKNELNRINDINTLVFDMDYTIIRYLTYKELKQSDKIYIFPILDELLVLCFQAIDNSKNFELLYSKFSEIKERLKINGEFITKMVDSILSKYTLPVSGMPEEIKFLSNYYDMKVFTDFSSITVNTSLKKCGLNNVMSDVLVSEPSYKKNKVESYERLLTKINKSSKEILMIGNSRVDVHASNIGINTILMDYNNKVEYSDLTYQLASAVITEPTDIHLLLKKQNK